MKLKTLITIGHGSYSGANSLRHCTSKKKALEELCYRGVNKEDAKKAIAHVLEKDFGAVLVEIANRGGVIELQNNLAIATLDKWPLLNYKNRSIVEQEYSHGNNSKYAPTCPPTHHSLIKDHTMKTLNTNTVKEVRPIFDRFTDTGYAADIERLRNKIMREAISGEYTTRSFWEQMTEEVFFPSLRFQVMDATHYYGKK